KVARFDAKLNARWMHHLTPTETDIRPKLLAADKTPTVRPTGWGNAAAEPLPLTPNLLATHQVLLTAQPDPIAPGTPFAWQNPLALLTDGKPDAPPKPWVGWTDIGLTDSGWRGPFTMQIETFRTRFRVTGITFVED